MALACLSLDELRKKDDEASVGPRRLAYLWPMFLLRRTGRKNVHHTGVLLGTRKRHCREVTHGNSVCEVMHVLWQVWPGESDDWASWVLVLLAESRLGSAICSALKLVPCSGNSNCASPQNVELHPICLQIIQMRPHPPGRGERKHL